MIVVLIFLLLTVPALAQQRVPDAAPEVAQDPHCQLRLDPNEPRIPPSAHASPQAVACKIKVGQQIIDQKQQ